MIDAVNTLQTSVQAAPVVSLSQPVQQVEQDAAPAVSRAYTALTIRVDVLNDIAILEAKSESGEVLRQYPTENQIASFKRAESLRERSQSESPLVYRQPAVSDSSSSQAQQQSSGVQSTVTPIQPQQANPTNSSAGVNVTQGTTATLSDTSSAGSTQSITV